MGRTWASPAGLNIYMSIILLADDLPELKTNAGLVPLAAGLAVMRGIKDATGLGLSLKWPNDLMAGERKLGGILLEGRASGNHILSAVLGIGINVNSRPEDFPGDIAAMSTSIRLETGQTHQREKVTEAVFSALDRELAGLGTEDGRRSMLQDYRRQCRTLGREITVRQAGGEVRGTASGIDAGGGLLLATSEGEVLVCSGDVISPNPQK